MSSENFKKSTIIKENAADDQRQLPSSYGKTEIVAMVRDPQWFFCYWEITPQKINQIKSKYGSGIFETAKPIIRVYDIINLKNTKDVENCTFFDEYISLNTENWYIKAKKSGKSYMCRIGLLTKDGILIKIADSNIIKVPLGGVSNITDEEWMVQEEEFNKFVKLSSAQKEASAALVHFLAKRWEILKSVTSGSMFTSSFNHISSRSPSECPLNLECEVVVKGGTCPQADITAGGKMVKVDSDGSFTANFKLPEGSMEIPVKCNICDNIKQKNIVIKANKKVTENE